MMENFDYVSFANYEKDMGELASRASGIIEHYKSEIKAREAVIWALVEAAGGRVTVSHADLIDPVKSWKIEDDPANKARIFIVKRTEATQ